MSRLQPHFDKLRLLAYHFSWYRHDFLDDTVEPDLSTGGLSCPTLAGPRSHIMRQVRSQHERCLRMQLLFAASRQQHLSGLSHIAYYLISRYSCCMHIISRKTLCQFWEQHPDSESALVRWSQIMQRHDFTSFASLRATFPTADKVGDFIVFNIGGNKYRLITAIHFNRRKVYIRHVLTHPEYDRGAWKL
jgi:mRNA interferase HigB